MAIISTERLGKHNKRVNPSDLNWWDIWWWPNPPSPLWRFHFCLTKQLKKTLFSQAKRYGYHLAAWSIILLRMWKWCGIPRPMCTYSRHVDKKCNIGASIFYSRFETCS
jgi:hypothetical protein